MMAGGKVCSGVRGELRCHEPMSLHTSWRAGGCAERYYIPADIDDLGHFLAFQDEREPIYWLGLGSNLLVRDGGIDGLMIATHGVMSGLAREGRQEVLVGAGVASAQLARFCAREGLADVGFLAGIPGTVGGALAMNAGALGGEIWDFVTAVETMDRQGRRRWRDADDFSVAYRHVEMPAEEWFVSARLTLQAGDTAMLQEQIRRCLRQRSDTQPAGQSSCGSVFRNPDGDYAGRLIEAAGLKGRRLGKAVISSKHANFIINEGGARAADIEGLITLAQREVAQRFAVELVPEVRIIGKPEAGA